MESNELVWPIAEGLHGGHEWSMDSVICSPLREWRLVTTKDGSGRRKHRREAGDERCWETLWCLGNSFGYNRNNGQHHHGIYWTRWVSLSRVNIPIRLHFFSVNPTEGPRGGGGAGSLLAAQWLKSLGKIHYKQGRAVAFIKRNVRFPSLHRPVKPANIPLNSLVYCSSCGRIWLRKTPPS